MTSLVEIKPVRSLEEGDKRCTDIRTGKRITGDQKKSSLELSAKIIQMLISNVRFQRFHIEYSTIEIIRIRMLHHTRFFIKQFRT